jgi:hypothetical protein
MSAIEFQDDMRIDSGEQVSANPDEVNPGLSYEEFNAAARRKVLADLGSEPHTEKVPPRSRIGLARYVCEVSTCGVEWRAKPGSPEAVCWIDEDHPIQRGRASIYDGILD